MAEDEAGPKPEAPQRAYNPRDYPPPTLPTIYSEGVWSASISPGVIKFYLVRTDASIKSDGTNHAAIIAQVVMPIVGFIQSVDFLQSYLNMMIENGTISKELVAQTRKNTEGGDGAPA